MCMRLTGYKIDLSAVDDIMALDKKFDALYQAQSVGKTQLIKSTQDVIENAQQIINLIAKYEAPAKELGDKGAIAFLSFRKKQAESRIKTANAEMAKIKSLK
jgi:hypothetical protein